MSKKKKAKKKRNSMPDIDVDQILLKNRQLFLHGVIDDKLANSINKELFALDTISHKPIVLRINSGGGSISAGFSIIDTIRTLHSPIITVVTGWACSMAGLISIVGAERVMFEHAIWMAHDLQAGNADYVTKMINYTDYLKKEQKRIFEFLGKHTKLSSAELTKARNGDLWLFAKEAKQKGVCDIVVK